MPNTFDISICTQNYTCLVTAIKQKDDTGFAWPPCWSLALQNIALTKDAHSTKICYQHSFRTTRKNNVRLVSQSNNVGITDGRTLSLFAHVLMNITRRLFQKFFGCSYSLFVGKMKPKLHFVRLAIM